MCPSEWITINLSARNIDLLDFVMEAKPDIKSFLIPIDIKKEIKVIEDAALRIIKNAMRHGHVAIVSNGKRPWLEVGMEILMPRLHKLCLFIDVTKQRVVYPKNKVLLISARNPIYASDQSKIPIAQALIDCLPNDIQVCSIGDNRGLKPNGTKTHAKEFSILYIS